MGRPALLGSLQTVIEEAISICHIFFCKKYLRFMDIHSKKKKKIEIHFFKAWWDVPLAVHLPRKINIVVWCRSIEQQHSDWLQRTKRYFGQRIMKTQSSYRAGQPWSAGHSCLIYLSTHNCLLRSFGASTMASLPRSYELDLNDRQGTMRLLAYTWATECSSYNRIRLTNCL